MGISINMGASGMKQNYSYLFQSISGNSNLNFLSDYASIKNGSYDKLLKAYYSKSGASKEVASIAQNKSSASASKDSAKTLSDIEKAADGMKSAADKLITKGKDSVFNQIDVESTDEYGLKTTTKEYDKDKIYKSVSSFVDSYNNLLKEASTSATTSIQKQARSLSFVTETNKNLLSKVGITIGEDGKLSVDEKKFKEADMTTVKSLFNENGSYGYRVSAQASLIDYAAEKESTKANTYTGRGSYGNTYNTGSIFDYGF